MRITPELVEKVRGNPGSGERYSENGRRNPIRQDTDNQLRLLTMLNRPAVVVEIGTGYGASTLCLADRLPDFGRIISFELSKDVATQVQGMFDDLGKPVTVVAGKFEEMLSDRTVPRGHVDMVFIDAEKIQYLAYLQLLEPYLAQGAVIIADNTIDRAEEAKDYLEYVNEHFETVTLNTLCGLTVSIYR